jgi:hypothetical protein
MPYINKDRRNDIDAGLPPETAGEMNYKITTILLEYIKRKGETYQTYNDIIGVLTSASHELYRRKISVYEEKKSKENGDVF